MRKIKFTEDFATRSKGDIWECDSLLASQLVNVDKVAIYEDVPAEHETESEPKVKKPKSK